MVRVGSSFLLDPTRNISPKIFCKKIIKIICKSYFNGLLRLKSHDFASMLKLVKISGTWDRK
jgi:hypothetical protein